MRTKRRRGWQPSCSTLGRAWAGFVGGRLWAHFVTLTVGEPRPPQVLQHQCQHRFLREVARVAGRAPGYFGAIEGSHCQMLLSGTSDLTCRQIERSWRLGRARVHLYDPARPAAVYITKELPQDGEDAFFLTDCRRKPLPLRCDDFDDRSGRNGGCCRGHARPGCRGKGYPSACRGSPFRCLRSNIAATRHVDDGPRNGAVLGVNGT